MQILVVLVALVPEGVALFPPPLYLRAPQNQSSYVSAIGGSPLGVKSHPRNAEPAVVYADGFVYVGVRWR